MSTISILSDKPTWRSRKVSYYRGDWTAILSVIPQFNLAPFIAGPKEPANPFVQIVMRLPLSSAERPIPVGIASNTYSLVPHREIAALCRKGLVDAGIDADDLRYEVGLSELAEWMNFRIYLPASYCFVDAHDRKLDLRLECFNSVDGSSRLIILFGWFRLVCSNGLVIGETAIEIKERHNRNLDLKPIPERIRQAMQPIEADRSRMMKWQSEPVTIKDVATWADGPLSDKWGRKAAARAFHIWNAGKDVEFIDPFFPGAATEKPVRYLERVPGSPDRATTKYDAAQALSFLATRRNNSEERVTWQADIPALVQRIGEGVRIH
jgi:hypothetical protein